MERAAQKHLGIRGIEWDYKDPHGGVLLIEVPDEAWALDARRNWQYRVALILGAHHASSLLSTFMDFTVPEFRAILRADNPPSADDLMRQLVPTFDKPEGNEIIRASQPAIMESDTPSPTIRHDRTLSRAVSRLYVRLEELTEEEFSSSAPTEVAEFIDQLDEADRPCARELGEIALLKVRSDRVRAQLNAAVMRAREAGCSWNLIGRAADVSPQAAHRRWDDEARRKHSEYERARRAAPELPMIVEMEEVTTPEAADAPRRQT